MVRGTVFDLQTTENSYIVVNLGKKIRKCRIKCYFGTYILLTNNHKLMVKVTSICPKKNSRKITFGISKNMN